MAFQTVAFGFLLVLKQTEAINAMLTYYESLPKCCPGTANYDAGADTTECNPNSGNACQWYGQLAYVPGNHELSYFKSNNIVSLYSTASGSAFPYNGTYITVSKPGYNSFVALVVDTCADSDCDGCCTQNTGTTGWLVDVEYWTAVANFGASGDECPACDGPVTFVPVNGPASSTPKPTTRQPTLKPTTRQPSLKPTTGQPTARPTTKQPVAAAVPTTRAPTAKPTTAAPTPAATGTACPVSQAGTNNKQGAAGSICISSADCVYTCSSTKAQCTTSSGTIPTCSLACPPQAVLNSGRGIPGAKCVSQADCWESCLAPSGSTITRCTSSTSAVPSCQ